MREKMAQTKAHRAYDRKMFTELGVNRTWYHRFIVPHVKRIKGNKCEGCEGTENLEVHHSDLKLINIDTLKLLCKRCHSKKHRKGCAND